MLEPEKAGVREFYETFGWCTDDDGTYKDTASFVDLRSVLSSYYRDTQLRVGRFLNPSGTHFLDAGSGPLSQREYLSYSAAYRYRVCIDLSARALGDARRKLDTHGLYVIGDVGHLPFRDGTFDGVLASHVLYHVPADEQAGAIHELYRTLNAGGRGVIIYIWPTSLLTKIGERVSRTLDLLGRFRSTLRPGTSREASPRGPTPATVPPLYFHPHDYRWMRRTLPKHWDTDIRVWRSVDFTFSRTLVSETFRGRALLRVIYWLEEIFPHAFARWGRYPCVVLEKPLRDA